MNLVYLGTPSRNLKKAFTMAPNLLLQVGGKGLGARGKTFHLMVPRKIVGRREKRHRRKIA